MVQPEWFNVDITDHKDTIYFNTGWGNGIEPARYEVRPLWTTKYQPKTIQTPAIGWWGLMSIPMIAFHAEKSLPELSYTFLDI